MRPFAVGLVALLALAGCTAGDERSSARSGVGDVPEDAEALPFVHGADIGDDGPFRLAMARPATYRPDEAALSDQAAVVVADLLYDGLTEIDGAGPAASLVPGLADSWVAAEDYRRWTFRLDPASGVEADAVVAGLTPVLAVDDAGAPPKRPGVALTAGMDSVVAVDALTVQIDLVRPNAGLPWILSGLPFSIVGAKGAPTGAYEIVREDARSLLLARRPEGDGSVGAFPEVEVVWTDDPEEAYRALIDGAAEAAIVGPESLGDATRRFGVTAAATSALRFYVLNPGSPELADRERRASLLALIDGPGLIDDAGRSALVPVGGLLAPSMTGHQPRTCERPCGPSGRGPDETPVEPSVSWPSDLPLRVTYVGEGQAAIAGSLAAQLAQGGIPASATQATARELATAIIEGSPDLFAFGWVAPAGTIDAVIPPLLREDSPANVARFASIEIEELITEAASTGDDGARWSLLEEAHRLALAEAKVLPVAASAGTLVVRPELSGITIRADGSLDLETFD